MKKAKQKLTNKDLMNAITNMAIEIEKSKVHVMNQDMVVSEYIKYKKDDEAFKAHLTQKFSTNDKDNKETEEK